MKIFESVAELKLSKLTAGQIVSTKGFYTAGDGGGAEYLIATSQAVDEYGDHTLANGNVALIQLNDDVVNVKQFGAVGDGITDDALAIQAAIDYAADNGGGEVFLPPATYSYGTNLFLKRAVTFGSVEKHFGPPEAYTTIVEGGYSGIAILKPTSAVTRAISFDFSIASKDDRPYGSVLRSIVIDCTDMSTGVGIDIIPLPVGEGPFSNGFMGNAFSIDNVYSTRAPENCLRAVGVTGTQKISFDVTRSHFSFAGEDCAYIEASQDVFMHKNFFFESQDGSGLYTTLCSAGRIVECDFFNNHVGVRAQSGNGVTDDSFDMRYNNCHIDNNYAHGIEFININGTSQNIQTRIEGCRITSNGGEDAAGVGIYSHIKIGNFGGVTLGGIVANDCKIGGNTHNGVPTAKMLYAIDQTTAAGDKGNLAVSCTFLGQDIVDPADYLSQNAWDTFRLKDCIAPDGGLSANHAVTLPDGVSKPSILASADYFITANSGATDLRGFSGWREGREIVVEIGDSNTTLDFTFNDLIGNEGVDYVAPLGTVMFCKAVAATNKWAVTLVKPS